MKKYFEDVRLHSIGYDNSMGLVRYILATAVIIAHFNVIYESSFRFMISSYDAVGAFFALSGFLMFGSYIKNDNLKKYLAGRAKRILPPYFLIVMVAAFGLVAVSSLSPHQYFSSSQFWRYLISNLCFLNFLQPTLPGVFTSSPVPAVDASLWTMKVEITLYLTVPIIIGAITYLRKKSIKLSLNAYMIIIYILSLCYRMFFTIRYEMTQEEIYLILGRQFLGQLMYFYSGVLIFLNFELFKRYRKWILIVTLIIFLLCNGNIYYRITAGPIVTAMLVLSFSFFRGGVKWFNYNNISYEMYLFHFPIINLMHHFFPQGNIYIIFFISFLLVVLFSSLSWYAVDKRFLPKRFV